MTKSTKPRTYDGNIVPDFLADVPEKALTALYEAQGTEAWEDVLSKVLDTTPEQFEASVKRDRIKHILQRDCPEGCGCTHILDDRDPERVRARFGPETCVACPECPTN